MTTGHDGSAASIALATVLIYGFTAPPGAVLFSRFVLRQPGDIWTAMFLSDFFGLLLAFSLGYLGDDATHAPRRWKTSPDFPGLADRLPDGAPMDDALFPVAWPR